jgi:hypothetical protein
MHLPKLPTVFVKGGEERKAFFTVQARELIAAGWVEKGTEAPKPVVKEEPKVEAPAEEPAVEEPVAEEKPKTVRRRTTKKVEE